MFRVSVFSRAALLMALALFVAVVGCQSQSNPDSKTATDAKTRDVSVEITGMS